MLNYEIEEDIVLDSNSVNNINLNTKEKKFNTKIEDVNISQGQNDNLKNNNSVEIDKELINKEKENTDKIDDNYEKDNDKRENALNTILYNVVDNKTKNDNFLESEKLNNLDNNNNNVNNDDEMINKSLEEEHVFDKKKEIEENKENKENKEKGENDSVNYDFDDGDNIIDIDYDKL